jgi:hypothetical protein
MTTERWTDETLDRFAATVATAIAANHEAIAASHERLTRMESAVTGLNANITELSQIQFKDDARVCRVSQSHAGNAG